MKQQGEGTPSGQAEKIVEMDLSTALSSQYDTMADEDPAPDSDSEQVTEDAFEAETESRSEVEEPEVREETDGEEERAESKEEKPYDEPPPERWPAEMKEAYRNLPPEAKRVMMEDVFKPMQRQYTKTTMELQQEKKKLQPMMEALERYQSDFEKAGANPAEVFQNTMAWAAHLQRVGPEQGIEDMRKSFGLTDGQGNEKPQQYLTPTERELKERLDRMESQQTEQMTAAQRAAEQQRQQAFQQFQQQVQKDLHEFVTEEKDGKPAHPHLNELSPTMKGLIEGGLVKRVDDSGRPVPFGQQLREAYDKAREMDPRFRAARSTEGQVRKAKAASDIGVTAKQSPEGRNEWTGNLETDLNRTYDRLSGTRR